jgi:dTDP-4-dehydrorhamnose reductase
VKILLTGANGQVGWELARVLPRIGEVMALDRAALDLRDPDRIRERVSSIRPAVIVNAAAYTAVDRAESEPKLAEAINAGAPAVLAEEAKRTGALLVHYSTDYVFDGAKTSPYVESDPPGPINAYGASKLRGEQAIQAIACRHLILRTSWVYGSRGGNFMLTVLRLARENPELRIVADQLGAPTWSRLIALTTAELLRNDKAADAGLMHLCAAGEASWHGFAGSILEQTRSWRTREPSLAAVTSAEYPTPAKRPRNSRLSTGKLVGVLGHELPAWQESLRACLSEAGAVDAA